MEVEVVVDVVVEVVARVMEVVTRWSKAGMRCLRFFGWVSGRESAEGVLEEAVVIEGMMYEVVDYREALSSENY